MDFSAYSEKDIQKFNGRFKDLPRITVPRYASPIVFMVVWIGLLSPLYIFLFFFLSFFIHWIFFVIGIILYIPCFLITRRLLSTAVDSGNDYALRMALFAERNVFSYRMQGGVYDVVGSIGSVLGHPATSNCVQGVMPNGVPFNLCSTYGKGLYVLLTVQLPNTYPHILLDSKSNNFGISNLLAHFPEAKEVVLEGDFPTYFRVFSAGSRVETLQILSPELMARMIDYPKQADIEIVGNSLQIILNYKKLTESDMRMLFTAASQILKDVGSASNNARVIFDSQAHI